MRARTAGIAAIVLLGLAYAMPAPDLGWNQKAHYALVRALADGTPRIDRTRYEVGGPTGDVSRIDGHVYAAKSPGLAFEALLPYLALKAAGGARAVADSTGRIWYLNLWGGLLPALILVLLVRYVAEGLEAGYGTIAAVTLGISTMVLPFATLWFAHALSAMLAFAAFAVLWRERRTPSRLGLVACAGVLAGLAATVEYPVAIVGAIVGLYGISRRPVLPRTLAFAAGAVIGGLPTLLYNRWAFGSAFKFPYSDVVPSPGQSTVNRSGLYGINWPSFHTLVELLFDRIGLLTLMPVLVLGAVGLVFLYRAGRRAEAILAGSVSLVYVLLIAGYETPFGGESPGPRFLVAILPFLALGLAATWRRIPLTTAVLAIGSAVEMSVLTVTHPLLAPTGGWFNRFDTGQFGQTSLGLTGIHHVGVPLFLGLLCAAAVLSIPATRRPVFSLRDAVTAVLALLGWLLLGGATPDLVDSGRSWAVIGLVVAVVAVVVLVPPAITRAGRFRAAVGGP